MAEEGFNERKCEELFLAYLALSTCVPGDLQGPGTVIDDGDTAKLSPRAHRAGRGEVMCRQYRPYTRLESLPEALSGHSPPTGCREHAHLPHVPPPLQDQVLGACDLKIPPPKWLEAVASSRVHPLQGRDGGVCPSS